MLLQLILVDAEACLDLLNRWNLSVLGNLLHLCLS